MRRIESIAWGVAVAMAVAFATVGCGSEQAAETAAQEAMEAEGVTNADVDISAGGENVSITGETEEGRFEVKAEGDSVTMTGPGTNISVKGAGGDVQLDAADGTASVKMGEGATLPDEWPSDVPMLEDLKLQMAGADTAQGAFTVNGLTGESPEEAAAWFSEQMKAEGWEETLNMNQSIPKPMRMLQYTKDERSSVINVMKTEQGTTVSVMVQGPQ